MGEQRVELCQREREKEREEWGRAVCLRSRGGRLGVRWVGEERRVKCIKQVWRIEERERESVRGIRRRREEAYVSAQDVPLE